MEGSERGPRLLVADDHAPFVEGIIRVVPERCGAIVVAVCSDGDQALREIEHLQPDVAMLDLRMPGLDGRQVLRAVNERGLTTRILLCSASLEPPLVHAALGEGATGYLAKTASWDEICGAVLAVARGQIWLSPSLQAGLNRQVGLRNRPLSDRERQVITLAADGLTDDQIARRLFVSRETVRTNLKRSSNKLGVSGRTALVATAIRQGLLE